MASFPYEFLTTISGLLCIKSLFVCPVAAGPEREVSLTRKHADPREPARLKLDQPDGPEGMTLEVQVSWGYRQGGLTPLSSCVWHALTVPVWLCAMYQCSPRLQSMPTKFRAVPLHQLELVKLHPLLQAPMLLADKKMVQSVAFAPWRIPPLPGADSPPAPAASTHTQASTLFRCGCGG